MRNLYLTHSEEVACNLEEIRDAQFISVDADSNIVYIASKTTLFAFNSISKQVIQNIALPCDSESSNCSAPVGLQYLYDNQAVCVATQDGQIYLWDTNSDELECVGEVEHGLVAMSWSPGLEIFVLVTAKNTMIMMSREFDPFTEVSIFPDYSGEEDPVTVGWGKKETQFHGSAGKDAAKVQAVAVEPAGSYDPGCPFVSWRGDGAFFVVSAIDPATGARSLYTWSRECIFQVKSESVNGLQHSVFWKPSGSVIASVQHKGKEFPQEVVFFEKNGLRHGQFSIPNSSNERLLVHCLMWNSQSSILLLWINKLSHQGADDPHAEIQLWTVNNYHWYQKQCLRFQCELRAVEWDTYSSNKLHVFTQQGEYLTYEWAPVVNATSGSKSDDLANVAVIDGDKLLMTPMRHTIVPPPMAAFTLTVPTPINFIVFHPTTNDFAVIMADERIAIFSFDEPNADADVKRIAAGGLGFNCPVKIPTLKNTLSIAHKHFHHALYKNHFLWIADTKLLYVTQDLSGENSEVHITDMKVDDGNVSTRLTLALDEPVIAVALNETHTRVALQTSCGDIFSFDIETDKNEPWKLSSGEDLRIPMPCPHMAVGIIAEEEVILGLTERNRFYINDLEVSSQCNSFALHNDFLLVSTVTHVIHCVSRSTKIPELPKLLDGKAHELDENTRKTERGSYIVSVVADDTTLVLQMPRGNLETITPRALVLRTLQKLMDSNEIMKTFVLMRKHRINLNLLYDHNPESFMANIDEFIGQVQKVNHFNLFISDLKEEDVTKTMYPASYPRSILLDSITGPGFEKDSKVDAICDTLMIAFKRLGEDRFFLPILTAHVRKSKPELEQALLKVWSLHGQEPNENGPTALEALKYLLFLVNVNDMYDVALGTYNFDLVMMVAGESQKDPKEYIPFLNQMRRLETNYQKYSIDLHLKKYNSALENISNCGDEYFEEAVKLINEHKLYRLALTLYKQKSVQHKEISSLYAAYLKTKNRNDEAGIMYSKGEEWESALECFRLARDWRKVFCMAYKLAYTENQVLDLANKMAVEMKENHRHLEASRIYDEYAKDPEEAIAVLIEGCLWSEASRLMHLHDRLDLVETHLLDALKESATQQMELLTEQKEQFDRHLNRLGVVRMQKKKEFLDYLEGVTYGNDADADLFSDTSSMTGVSVSSHRTADSSRSTVFSKATGSSRSRRKAESKKWSLKEGSANEEFALIDALAKIINCVDGGKAEVNLLMKALVEYNYDTKAAVMQAFYSSFLSNIQLYLDRIWINDESPAINTLGPGTTANAIALAMQRGQNQQLGVAVTKDPVLAIPPKINKDVRWKLHIAGDLDK